MTGANPIVTTPPPTSTGKPSTPSSNLNELGPNAFITLLTAQLQAQDPLNPMDPNQMVSELTSMNTLQETIQIRQDLDSLVSASQGSSGTGGTGSSGTGGPGTPSPTGPSAPTNSIPNPAAPVAANALKSGLAALATSLTPGSVSRLYSQGNSKSQAF